MLQRSASVAATSASNSSARVAASRTDALEMAAVRRGVALAVDLVAGAVAQELLDHVVRRLAGHLDLVERLDAGEPRAAPPLAPWRTSLCGAGGGGHRA